MKKILISVLAVSFSSHAAQCPTKAFEGSFNVVEVQGCENRNPSTHVDSVENRLDQDGDLEIRINYKNGSIQNLYSSPSIIFPKHEKCKNRRNEKYYRWFPQPKKVFYTGFLYKSGSFFSESGSNCRYKLEKI